MVVFSVSSCPKSLRGDLTKWLLEIDTGVYVGRISARVRDELWERACKYAKNGQVIMVYNAQTPQGYAVRTYKTKRTPVDLEGITLMLSQTDGCKKKSQCGKTPRVTHEKQIREPNMLWSDVNDYAVINLETTGLDEKIDKIIKIVIISVHDGKICGVFSELINPGTTVPKNIEEMTGITTKDIVEKGIGTEEAIQKTKQIVGESVIICHNTKFVLKFLNEACLKIAYDPFVNRNIDTLSLARKCCPTLTSYKLISIAQSLHIETIYQEMEKAEQYGVITHQLFEKLKKFVR